MMVTKKNFHITDISSFKEQARQWSMRYQYVAILENNAIPYYFDPFVNVLAVGSNKVIDSSPKAFEDLKVFCTDIGHPAFGYLSYDLKNQIEKLKSINDDFQQAPELCFFIPDHIIYFNDDSIEISSTDSPDEIFEWVSQSISEKGKTKSFNGMLKAVNKQDYIENVNKIKEHIINGDIYELNYCIEFSIEDAEINPLSTFTGLIEKSPMPFSFFFKAKEQFVICSSPERFIRKVNNQLISQPIKGTIRRGNTIEEDELLKERLSTSEKELAENLMIVDLVRNDLAISSVPGTVVVNELFGIYSFKQLHQMISTVSSIKRAEVHPIDTIKNAFPMGSMTGAPKIRAMQLIEEFESSKRGAFSGAAGYITPDLNFDFNVLIRSIFYNEALGRLSFQVGSAITYDADPEYEYNECLLKAKSIFEVLGLKDK